MTYMIQKETILFGILTVMLLIAAIQDVRMSKIPNWLTYSAMLGAISYHSVLYGLKGFLFSIEGIAVGSGALIIPYLLRGMGAGDAKLMGAVGGLLGPRGVFAAFLVTALIGGIYALIVVACCGYLKDTLQRYSMLIKTFLLTGKIMYIPPAEQKRMPRLRYGIAIGIGTLSSLFLNNAIFN